MRVLTFPFQTAKPHDTSQAPFEALNLEEVAMQPGIAVQELQVQYSTLHEEIVQPFSGPRTSCVTLCTT